MRFYLNIHSNTQVCFFSFLKQDCIRLQVLIIFIMRKNLKIYQLHISQSCNDQQLLLEKNKTAAISDNKLCFHSKYACRF